ncbi:cholestenol Delta-isomerase [Geosmithia morbida]|uniref:Cholestenol Delta-isomerase n=1 Tax=Geosmithia morbida TaxID=1094350 RepID=A0A9P4YW46_9HYPO|nr:cholestenol Delta-isomerase [Geosmithia morbida]KAF4123100.1 cholestenol Delta-isomerase [Geosmithia morbida]
MAVGFTDPAGVKTGKALPTGNSVDVLDLGGSGTAIPATLMDRAWADPGASVSASDVRVGADEATPENSNSSSLPAIAGSFGAIIAVVVVVAYRCAANVRPVDRFAAAWFALCGFLHVSFEGYYIYHRHDIAGMNTLFAQLWKEYTLSDSRYLTLDVFTVCVEMITVFVWGPLSLLVLLAILRGHDGRHPLQIIVCVAHLYGVTLYYATNWAEGLSCSRPEFLYYWVYYAGFNSPWVFVPLVLLYDSFSQIQDAFAAVRRHTHTD